MTHRVHPYIFRIGQTTNWKSRWFNRKKFQEYLREDTLLREYLRKKLAPAHIAEIEIERSPTAINVIIKTAKPGILIGRGGEGMTRLRQEIDRQLIKIWKRTPVRRKTIPEKREVKITVEDIKNPTLNAAVVAQMMVDDIERRMPFRRVIKQTIEKVMANKEVKGVKVAVSGRLDGSEMARYEWLKKGRIPLQTLRSDIDYAHRDAFTTYGNIGVKVWIYKGDVFEKEKSEARNRKP